MCTTDAASTQAALPGVHDLLKTKHSPSQSSQPEQRHRLAKVLDLARVYRGCGVEALARDLGRDPTRLIADSGNPKVDLVVGIANALEWPIAHVIQAILGEKDPTQPDAKSTLLESKNLDYKSLRSRCITAHRAGQWGQMLGLSRAMLTTSQTSTERATAYSAIGVAYDGMGRYANALKVLQQGLTERGVAEQVRFMLRANLANAHYTLWHLIEARAIAAELIDQLAEPTPSSRLERVMWANANYVRGNSLRRMLREKRHSTEELCARARADLAVARENHLRFAEEFEDESYRGVANTCAGALLELDAACGAIEPADALRQIEAGLAEALRAPHLPSGDHLESWGWWAIFGANIALRHLPIQDAHEPIAQLHRSLHTTAEQNDHWAFRASAFSIELRRRDQARQAGVALEEWTLDPSDMENLVFTMGRLPAFQPTGWRILTEFGVLEQATKIDPRTWRKGLRSA